MYDFEKNIKKMIAIAEISVINLHEGMSNRHELALAELYSDNSDNRAKMSRRLYKEIIAEIKKLQDEAEQRGAYSTVLQKTVRSLRGEIATQKPVDDSDYHDDDSQYASWHDDPGLFGTH